jgi:hypothetical protein
MFAKVRFRVASDSVNAFGIMGANIADMSKNVSAAATIVANG